MSIHESDPSAATAITGGRAGRRTLVALALGASLALAACGGSSDEPDGGSSATAPSASAAPTSPVTESIAPAATSPDGPASDGTEPQGTPQASADPAAAAAAGEGPIQIEFDDGRSWTVEGTCRNNPDASGMSAEHWSAIGEDVDGATLNALYVNSLDPDDPEPTLVANFIDEDSTIFAGIAARQSVDGSTLTIELDMHEGFKTNQDPPDLVATITCAL